MHYQDKEIIAEMWILKGAPANAADRYKEMLAVSKELKYDFGISESLTKIAELVEKGVQIWRAEMFIGELADLPIKYQAHVDRIRRAVQKNSN
jgi:hypothetical protein